MKLTHQKHDVPDVKRVKILNHKTDDQLIYYWICDCAAFSFKRPLTYMYSIIKVSHLIFPIIAVIINSVDYST